MSFHQDEHQYQQQQEENLFKRIMNQNSLFKIFLTILYFQNPYLNYTNLICNNYFSNALHKYLLQKRLRENIYIPMEQDFDLMVFFRESSLNNPKLNMRFHNYGIWQLLMIPNYIEFFGKFCSFFVLCCILLNGISFFDNGLFFFLNCVACFWKIISYKLEPKTYSIINKIGCVYLLFMMLINFFDFIGYWKDFQKTNILFQFLSFLDFLTLVSEFIFVKITFHFILISKIMEIFILGKLNLQRYTK